MLLSIPLVKERKKKKDKKNIATFLSRGSKIFSLKDFLSGSKSETYGLVTEREAQERTTRS